MLWPMLFAAQHRFSFFSCTNSFLRFFVVFFFLGYQSLVKSSVVTGYDTYVQHFLFFPQSLISLFPQFSLHSSSVFSAANFFIVVLRWLTCRLPFFPSQKDLILQFCHLQRRRNTGQKNIL